jgi:hypothetical protein
MMPRFSLPNPLAKQEPELVERLASFRLLVTDMLLDKLAAVTLREPAFRARECPHRLEEVKATAQVLRVLVKDAWDKDDLAILVTCWRQASQFALFADEFEAERHRISQCIETAREQCLAKQCQSSR